MLEMSFSSPERWVQDLFPSVISLKLRLCTLFCKFHYYFSQTNDMFYLWSSPMHTVHLNEYGTVLMAYQAGWF
jgi:hypothetical protein